MAFEQRSQAWLRWMADVRSRLLQTQFGEAPEAVRPFFLHQWTMHSPALFPVAPMPAMAWSLPYLRQKAGNIEVEVQAGRNSDPGYEIRSPALKQRMPFAVFLDEVEQGAPNDVYLTANNAAANAALMAVLRDDLQPLPEMLNPNAGGRFLWIGKESFTPNHHDLSNLVMIQLVGERHVRLMPPSEQPRLDNYLHVFSRLASMDDLDRGGVAYIDVILKPGDALFVPVGWWHAVYSPGVSIMASFTNFWWPNNWTDGFPAG